MNRTREKPQRQLSPNTTPMLNNGNHLMGGQKHKGNKGPDSITHWVNQQKIALVVSLVKFVAPG